MKRGRARRAGGYTLVETMVATGVGSIMMGMALSGSILIQRTFLATDFHSTTQTEQLRVSDYLARDLRPATLLVISRAGQQLDVTLPPQDTSLLQVHLDLPVVGSLMIGTPPVNRQIRYTLAGTELYREEDGARVRLAQNLTEFTAVRTGATVNVTTSFIPQYTQDPARAPREFTKLRQTILCRYAN